MLPSVIVLKPELIYIYEFIRFQEKNKIISTIPMSHVCKLIAFYSKWLVMVDLNAWCNNKEGRHIIHS